MIGELGAAANKLTDQNLQWLVREALVLQERQLAGLKCKVCGQAQGELVQKHECYCPDCGARMYAKPCVACEDCQPW